MTIAPRPRLAAAERRQAVLDTACRIFSESSYRGATTAEIAREAGITEPILYRHFGSKRELYLACLDEAWRSFREAADEAIKENPAGCFGAISDAYMAKRARLRLVDLWIQSLVEASDDPVIAKALRDQIHEVHAFLADVVRHGQEQGSINPDRDPVAEAWIFVAAGMLVTMDERLGDLLGADLEAVRASRRAWMLNDPS